MPQTLRLYASAWPLRQGVLDGAPQYAARRVPAGLSRLCRLQAVVVGHAQTVPRDSRRRVQHQFNDVCGVGQAILKQLCGGPRRR